MLVQLISCIKKEIAEELAVVEALPEPLRLQGEVLEAKEAVRLDFHLKGNNWCRDTTEMAVKA